MTFKRFKHYERDGWVEDRFMSDEPFQLSHFMFEKLASLLQLLKDLDLASLNQPRIPVVEGEHPGRRSGVREEAQGVAYLARRSAKPQIFDKLYYDSALLRSVVREGSIPVPSPPPVAQSFQ